MPDRFANGNNNDSENNTKENTTELPGRHGAILKES
jgi:hypothetical protein